MNIPNRLTLLRVLMVPAFVIVFLLPTVSDWWALALFVLAGFTDLLDGAIARKKNMVTDFGKLMDPLADKLMLTAALVCFTYAGLVHPAVTIVVLSRELLVTGLRTLAISKGKVIAADFWGKLKTVAQDVTIVVILVWQSWPSGSFNEFCRVLSVVCVWVMLALTVISAIHYCIVNKDIFENAK